MSAFGLDFSLVAYVTSVFIQSNFEHPPSLSDILLPTIICVALQLVDNVEALAVGISFKFQAHKKGCLINDQSPNIKILKVPRNFPIKYGPKDRKNP